MNKPPKPVRPIENLARVIALMICMSVPGVWVALHAAVVAVLIAGNDPSALDEYIAGMQNLVLLVTGAAIALAFQTNQQPNPTHDAADTPQARKRIIGQVDESLITKP